MVSMAPTYRVWKENFPGQIARFLLLPFSPSPELGWQKPLVKQDHASKYRVNLGTNCTQEHQGHCCRMILLSRLQYSPSIPDNQMAVIALECHISYNKSAPIHDLTMGWGCQSGIFITNTWVPFLEMCPPKVHILYSHSSRSCKYLICSEYKLCTWAK